MLETRKYFFISIIFIGIISIGTVFISSVDNRNTTPPVGGKDRPYHFRIELSQWSMRILDLNQIEDLILAGSSVSNAILKSTYVDYIGNLEKGSQVFLQIYSLDVQHGMSINDLDIYISILEPTDDIASTIPYFYDFYLPEYDTSFTGYCHIYCGIGHSNMKLRFDVGIGVPHYGQLVFNITLFLIAIMAITFAYFITSNIRTKVYISELSVSTLKSKNSKKFNYALYDISMLSDKELINLRLGTLNVEMAGDLIKEFTAKSSVKAREKIISQKDKFNWNLVEL